MQTTKQNGVSTSQQEHGARAAFFDFFKRVKASAGLWKTLRVSALEKMGFKEAAKAVSEVMDAKPWRVNAVFSAGRRFRKSLPDEKVAEIACAMIEAGDGEKAARLLHHSGRMAVLKRVVELADAEKRLPLREFMKFAREVCGLDVGRWNSETEALGAWARGKTESSIRFLETHSGAGDLPQELIEKTDHWLLLAEHFDFLLSGTRCVYYNDLNARLAYYILKSGLADAKAFDELDNWRRTPSKKLGPQAQRPVHAAFVDLVVCDAISKMGGEEGSVGVRQLDVSECVMDYGGWTDDGTAGYDTQGNPVPINPRYEARQETHVTETWLVKNDSKWGEREELHAFLRKIGERSEQAVAQRLVLEVMGEYQGRVDSRERLIARGRSARILEELEPAMKDAKLRGQAKAAVEKARQKNYPLDLAPEERTWEEQFTYKRD